MPNITNSWIIDQIDMLWEKCHFKPKGQPFLLDFNYFYDTPTCKEKVIFLMKRYNLPFEEIKIYIHAGLEQAGRVELQRVFDTEKLDLQPGQKIMSLENDGTFTVLDLKNPDIPKLIKVNKSLPLKSISFSMFLNQDFIASGEVMDSIISH